MVDTDFVLIRRMKQGSQEAFEMFVRKYYGDVLAYCGCRCFDRGQAEDVTQEVFVRFFSGLSRYDHRGKAKNYLFTVAGNLCRDEMRKRRDIQMETVEELEKAAKRQVAGEDDKYDAVVDSLVIRRALSQLPDELREVMALRYFADMKVREIAEILHIKVPLVKYRLRKGREKMKEMCCDEET